MDYEYMAEIDNLKKYFPVKPGIFKRMVGHVHAVDGVSFKIKKGRTFGLAGESGCGKTTVGRTVLRLLEPDYGRIKVGGTDICSLKGKELRLIRPKMQMIFQNPLASLDPRMPVGEIIGEAVREHKLAAKQEFDEYIRKVMGDCGLSRDFIDYYPHELSGGQRQRICIARALALDPDFVVCDEPVYALDASIKAQIINLMMDLQEKRRLTYLFISHDLPLLSYISDAIGIMYLGNMVETGPGNRVFKEPLHPYTRALLNSRPAAGSDVKIDRILLPGDIPSPVNPPKGCKFHTRCPQCFERCREEVPAEKDMGNGHMVSCHLY